VHPEFSGDMKTPIMKNLFHNEWISRLIDALMPVFATLAALLLGAVMLLLLKVNPLEAYSCTSASS
jgi:ABC-type uncharacterized transport system permease subunit